MRKIDRRTSLIVLSSVLGGRIDDAVAQIFAKYLGSDVSNALKLQQLASNAPLEKDIAQSSINFVASSVDVRRRAVLDAQNSGVFRTPEVAISEVRSSIGTLVEKDYYITESYANSQIEAINFIALQGVPLVPEVDDILPIGIPVADPVEQKNEDTNLGVILDILLQTIGIFDGKQLVDEFLNDPDVNALLHELAPTVKSKDWNKLLDIGEPIFKLFLATKTFNRYAAYSKKVGKRIAFRLGLRCVPLIGWAYVVAAFLLALKANYHRFSFA